MALRSLLDKPLETSIYISGEYLRKNPDWHVDESPWKAKHLATFLQRNELAPVTVCDIGCGAGEVLAQLQQHLPSCEFTGYEISPQAFRMCQQRVRHKLTFKLADIRDEHAHFDLALILDVIEHLEDYFTFLREIISKARSFIFHVPLDLSVQTVARSYGLLKRRALHDHLHYFTKETALRTLEDTGYDIRDYIYTPRSNEMGTEVIQKLLKFPRAALYGIHKDTAVRLLGGYSLLVLASAK
jgi:2-polyprenyl-3-methyl-5-hydroxy-6-metoxy-1,4-benzoquinol methylase